MALEDFCTDNIVLDQPVYSKKPNTNIRYISGYTNIGSLRAQTQIIGSRLATIDDNNQEGLVEVWGAALIKDELEALPGFNYKFLMSYRVTLPTGKYGRITDVDRNTSPSNIITESVVLEIEESEGT